MQRQHAAVNLRAATAPARTTASADNRQACACRLQAGKLKLLLTCINLENFAFVPACTFVLIDVDEMFYVHRVIDVYDDYEHSVMLVIRLRDVYFLF